MDERAHIISEIKRLHTEMGTSPGIAVFVSETGILKGRILGVHWARWSDALAEAGLSSNELQKRFDSDELLEGLAFYTRKIGRYPSNLDLRLAKRQDQGVANEKVYTRHFGNAAGVRNALRTFCEGRAEFTDVLGLIPIEGLSPSRPADSDFGHVYLMQSGPHFKIGRTENLERRFREISVSLPQSTNVVHSISTDDPAGIENYWHRRFANRRAKGEWFKLTREDVRAFKRRKFQ